MMSLNSVITCTEEVLFCNSLCFRRITQIVVNEFSWKILGFEMIQILAFFCISCWKLP